MLLNLSNDFWSMSVQAELQHYQLAVFRAIENRVPLLRSTNSGITCLVLPDGTTQGKLDTFTQAWGIYEVPIYEDKTPTFYTLYPDLFGKGYVVISISSVLISVIYDIFQIVLEKRRKKRMEEERLSTLFVSMDEKVEC